MSIEKNIVTSFDKWKAINNPLLDGIGLMEIVTSENATIGRAKIDSRVKLKSHHHVEEQITTVLDGAMEVNMNGKVRVFSAGDVCIIPSDVEHEVEITVVPFLSFDIFTPCKKDYIEKTLMGEKNV